MILDQQISELVLLVAGDMSNGQSGTSSTLFDKTQTALQTPVGATDLALIDQTSTETNVFGNHVLGTSVGNSNTFTEHEVNDGSGVSYNRSVKADVVKIVNLELTVAFSFEWVVVL